MKPPKIVSAQAIDDHILSIEFSNHEVKRYDISKLFEKPMFKPLKNPHFFRSFKVDVGGYGLVWNDEIDISEHELWQNSISQTATEQRNHGF